MPRAETLTVRPLGYLIRFSASQEGLGEPLPVGGHEFRQPVRIALARGLNDVPVCGDVIGDTVMAMAVSGMTAASAAGAPMSRQLLERTADALSFHLSVVTPGSVAALVGDVCYAIVPSPAQGANADDLPEKAQSAARDFLQRASDGLTGVVLGIGRAVDSAGPADLARSRHDADRTLRVLRQRPGRRVARYSEVQVDALLLELGDLLRSEGGLPDGPIERLRTYDRGNGTALVETPTARLDSLGNVLGASASLDVHPKHLPIPAAAGRGDRRDGP